MPASESVGSEPASYSAANVINFKSRPELRYRFHLKEIAQELIGLRNAWVTGQRARAGHEQHGARVCTREKMRPV